MAHRHRAIRKPVAKMALSTFAAGAVVLGGTGMAQACENGAPPAGSAEAGTVQSVNGSVITLLDRAGNTDTVTTDGNTMYETEGGSPASPSGVADGDFLWAFGSFQADGSLLASRVKYGPANQSDTSPSNTSRSSFQARSLSQSEQSTSTRGDDDHDFGRHHRHHHHRG
jgi:hypothetical protein